MLHNLRILVMYEAIFAVFASYIVKRSTFGPFGTPVCGSDWVQLSWVVLQLILPILELLGQMGINFISEPEEVQQPMGMQPQRLGKRYRTSFTLSMTLAST